MLDARWSIEELRVRYELEPGLRDVFVEGGFDCDILTRAYSERGGRPTFYSIDVVDVPGEILARNDLTLGNKQRVISLAKELSLLPSEARVVCLVDRDLDHWFDGVPSVARLKWTMYCCIESHFITRGVMADILLVTARAKINDFDIFLDSLKKILSVLFAFRLADKDLAFNLKWVSLKKYLNRDGDLIAFDVDKYVLSLLNSNSKAPSLDDFSDSYKGWLEKLNGDVRMFSRGHDYTEMLAWAIREFGGQCDFAREAAIERLFVLLAGSVETISAEFS